VNSSEAMVEGRKRAARRKSNVQYNEQESSELSDYRQDSEISPQPTRKRTRGKTGASGPKTKKKGKARQKSSFLEVPLDLMFEVSGFLRMETVWFRRLVGFMACRSSAASSPEIYCNCLGRPRPFVVSS